MSHDDLRDHFEERVRQYKRRRAAWDRSVADARRQFQYSNPYLSNTVFEPDVLRREISDMLRIIIAGRLHTLCAGMYVAADRFERYVSVLTLPPPITGLEKYAPKGRLK